MSLALHSYLTNLINENGGDLPTIVHDDAGLPCHSLCGSQLSFNSSLSSLQSSISSSSTSRWSSIVLSPRTPSTETSYSTSNSVSANATTSSPSRWNNMHSRNSKGLKLPSRRKSDDHEIKIGTAINDGNTPSNAKEMEYSGNSNSLATLLASKDDSRFARLEDDKPSLERKKDGKNIASVFEKLKDVVFLDLDEYADDGDEKAMELM